MNFLKSALAHWKTSTAGLAAAALIVANSYKTGMSWKQWGLAAAIALFGISAGDALPAAVPATAAAPKP